MVEIIYKDLSYQIVGVLYKIYNELGGGYQEKYYQRAIALELKNKKVEYLEQLKVDLKFSGQNIGKYFLDFLIDSKIILEIKATPRFYSRDIKQILGYLKATNLRLGILASFTKSGLKFKRLVN